MTLNVAREVALLKKQTAAALRTRYADLFGETTRSGHKAWLVKRIAWRLQALAEGDLSERARRRAAELANEADLRLRPPADECPAVPSAPRPKLVAPDDRLPPPGTVLSRPYKGRQLQVTVLPDGFLFDGEVYASLSAVAKAATGSHCNGFHFFRLGTYGVSA